MKQLSAVEKKKLGMPLVDSATKRWIKRRMLPIILKMAQSTIKYEVISNSICKPVPAKPIIYAMNHSEINDFPILCNNINTDCYILAGKQSLDFGGSLFFSPAPGASSPSPGQSGQGIFDRPRRPSTTPAPGRNRIR